MTFARLLAPSPPVRGCELAGHLRSATASAHEHLEQSLDLLGRVHDRQRFVAVLEGFLGFHVIWEQAIRERPALRLFHEPRSRLPHLRRDLRALGRTEAQIAAAPHCHQAASLASSDAAAIGSIYVMEGSTLGGQVIGRALAGAAWLPQGGLSYFSPYGARTGEMWRAFKAWAEEATPADDHAVAADAANRTFSLLRTWLPA